MDTDRNLLFGVLALQMDLIDARQFVEACTVWTTRKDLPLADLLEERGWITATDKADLQRLLERKLKKHGGDAKVGLAAVADDVKRSLAALEDAEIQRSLAGLAPASGPPPVVTVDHVPEAPERYTLTRLHATGGIGRVWLARDAHLGRDVALKELRPERARDPRLCSRFLREAQVTGQLEHPGVVPVYELARRPDSAQPFYTMRFVKGRTLSEAARAYHQQRAAGRDEPLELLALLNAFVGVCNTVAYAHSRGVIHRDLKGQNVALGDFGEVIVLDWGLAKVVDRPGADETLTASIQVDPQEGSGEADLTAQGQALGTPAYMAPEQAAGRLDLIDPRTDVYGLGAILYEILTGQPPFTGPDTHEVLRKVRHEEPAPPRQLWAGVPPTLETACLRALAKKPADRYASAGDLAQEVQHWQEVQRRQAEEALRRQTHILQSILDGMSEGVVVADEAGQLLLWNPAAEQIIGMRLTNSPPEEWAERYGCYLPDAVTPYPSEELPLARALRGEDVDDAELFIRHAQKPEGVWLSINARPLKDEAGLLRGGVTAFRSISKRKRAEEALRQKSALLKLLQVGATAANEAAVLEDALQVVLDQVCAHTGWPVGHAYILADDAAGGLVPTTIWHLDNPQLFDTFRRVTQATRMPPGAGLPGRILVGGKPAWIMDVTRDPNFPRARLAEHLGVKAAFGFPVLAGAEVVAVLEFFSPEALEPDQALLEVMAHLGTQLGRVVERERAAKALRESEVRFRSVAHAAQDAIIAADHRGHIIFWNQGARTIFGYDDQEVLGRPLTLVMPERYRDAHQQGLRRLLETGQPRVIGKTVELHGLRKDGREFPLELSLAAWATGQGRFFSGIIRDITERKRAEQALRESQAFYHSLVESLPQNIYRKDRAGRFTFGNQRFCAILGQTPGAIVGKTDFDFFPPELAAKYRRDDQQVIASGKPWETVEEHATPAGERLYVQVIKTPIPDARGEIIGTQGIFWDVTERQRAEEALARERNLLRTLIDNLPDYIIIKDADSRFVTNNQAHLRVLQATPDEVVGKTDFDFFPRELAEQYFTDERAVVRSGQPLINREEPVVDEEGNRRWLLTSKLPLRDSDGKVTGLVCVCRDITGRKQAEEALTQERNLLRILIDNLPDYIYIKDTDSRFRINNLAHVRALGAARPEEVVGKTDFDFFPQELAARYFADEQEIIRTGIPLVNREQPRVDRAGNRQWVVASKLPLRDTHGKIVGILGISRDITERKRAEEERQPTERPS
jgi:PAS domain S-box-containing protein